MESEKKDLIQNDDVQQQSKKPYKTPKVTVHGTVEQMTQTIGLTTADGITGSTLSDRNLKEHFTAVNMHEVLARLMTLRIETWNYKNQHCSIRHIGPMAQDFFAAFGVGEDDRHINLLDASGVAFTAIQALYQMVKEKDVQILALQIELDELKQRVFASEAKISDTIRLAAATACCPA